MTGGAERPGTSAPGRSAPAWPDEPAQYEQWRERVRSTYRAVEFTCGHRLADPSLAAPVAAGVVRGLLSRPTVFRYFGLPFSGRIATLAEDLLARADAGEPVGAGSWPEIEARLDALPGEHRAVLLAVCVRGEDVPGLARTLGCDEQAATARRAATLDYMRDVVAAGTGAAREG